MYRKSSLIVTTSDLLYDVSASTTIFHPVDMPACPHNAMQVDYVQLFENYRSVFKRVQLPDSSSGWSELEINP